MFFHDFNMEDAIKFSRFDRDHLLASASPHPITLDEREWQTCEHYVCAKLAASAQKSEQIAAAPTPELANKLIGPWYVKKVPNWKNVRRVLMTRAIYTKTQMYDELRDFLLDTGDSMIIETSAYDHYWGVGRDLRGKNVLGQVWMDVRDKLRGKGKK